jgi:hypothetical protein
LAVGILMLVLLAVRPEITLFLMCILFIVLGALWDLHRVVFRRKESPISSPKESA